MPTIICTNAWRACEPASYTVPFEEFWPMAHVQMDDGSLLDRTRATAEGCPIERQLQLCQPPSLSECPQRPSPRQHIPEVGPGAFPVGRTPSALIPAKMGSEVQAAGRCRCRCREESLAWLFAQAHWVLPKGLHVQGLPGLRCAACRRACAGLALQVHAPTRCGSCRGVLVIVETVAKAARPSPTGSAKV